MFVVEYPPGPPQLHTDHPPVLGDREQCSAAPFQATPTVEDLGAVTSGLQFEPCRFPTTASQLEDHSTDLSSVNVARLQRCETETTPPFASRVHLLQTTWAILLRNYVRDDYVSFGLVGVEAYHGGYAKAVVCQLGSGIRDQGGSICEISNRVVSQHVITEKQMNTAIEVNIQASDTVSVEAAQTRREVSSLDTFDVRL